MASVQPRPSGEPGALLHLEEIEIEILRSLVRQLVDFVGVPADPDADPLAVMVGIDPDAAPSEDPALLRLLPNAFPDDDEASSEFRRFTERELRDAKVRNAGAVGQSLEGGPGVLEIDADLVPAWLGFLNDTRLIIGARLDVTEDNHEELAALPDDDPRAALFGMYGWLTYLQESMVQLMLGEELD